MTPITSDVSRRTVEDREGGLTRKGRRIIVTIGPANMIKLRGERTQEEYTIMVDELWRKLEYNAAAATVAKRPVKSVRRSVI
jgi:hypothetical protein